MSASDITVSLSLSLSAAELSLLLRELILKLFSEHLSADGKVTSSTGADSRNAFMCGLCLVCGGKVLCKALHLVGRVFVSDVCTQTKQRAAQVPRLTLCVFVQRPFIYEKLSVFVCSPCSHSLWTT